MTQKSSSRKSKDADDGHQLVFDCARMQGLKALRVSRLPAGRYDDSCEYDAVSYVNLFRAAKACGSRCAFVRVVRLEDADFIYVDETDLRPFSSKVARFSNYIGKDHSSQVAVVIDGLTITTRLKSSQWYHDFLVAKEAAIQRYEEKARAHVEKVHAQVEIDRSRVIEAAMKLLDDKSFVLLPTKGAMAARLDSDVPTARSILDPRQYTELMTKLHQQALLRKAKK